MLMMWKTGECNFRVVPAAKMMKESTEDLSDKRQAGDWKSERELMPLCEAF